MSIFLGTGACEGIPAPFCECPTCRNARNNIETQSRMRSAFLIDEESLIDYGPDIRIQCVKNNINLINLKNIFITHSHDDHIAVSELILRRCTTCEFPEKVNIYASANTLKQIVGTMERYLMPDVEFNESHYYKNFNFIPLEAYKDYKISDMKVTPILSSHYGFGEDELGFNYIITNKLGNTFLYASDTGWYRDITWEYLKNNEIKFDFAVMECTYGDYEMPDYEEGHLDFKNLKYMLEKMTKYGNVDYSTPIYLTHICHLNTLTSKEMVDYFKRWEWNIIPGYDGLRLK